MPDAAVKDNFQEFSYSSGDKLRVDRERNLVLGVKILGPASRNTGSRANDYPVAAQIKAVPMLEGSAVFFDHNTDARCRSYKDRNGSLVNVRQDGDSVYADHAYNPKHALTEQYLWDAERAPQNVCFSINGAGLRRFNSTTKRWVVEEIVAANSVDLVSRGGTTNTLFESTDEIEDPETRELAEQVFSATSDVRSLLVAGHLDINSKRAKLVETLDTLRKVLVPSGISQEKVMEWKDVDVESLKANRKELYEQITGTDKVSQLTTQVAAIQEELKAEKAKALALEEDKAKLSLTAKIAEELKTAKLDASSKIHVSDVFMECLQGAKDSAARAKLIEDRVSTLKVSSAPASAPFSSVGSTATGSLSEVLAKLR